MTAAAFLVELLDDAATVVVAATAILVEGLDREVGSRSRGNVPPKAHLGDRRQVGAAERRVASVARFTLPAFAISAFVRPDWFDKSAPTDRDAPCKVRP